MKADQSRNPILRLRPCGSLRYFRAMALGGVPIMVPIPPMLAPTGIAIVRAILPLPLAGKALKTGVRKVSIIAAVAVLDTNMENTPVIKRKPRRTFSDLCPKGFIRFLAIMVSSPDLDAANARMNPPKKSITIGSAIVAIMDSWLINWFLSIPDTMDLKELSETVNSMIPMREIEVAQAGIASEIHRIVANANIAIIRS